jgi:hypothetical protein
MNKTPGEVQPAEPMTTVERNARKAFRKVEEKQAMTDHETAQKAFAKNHARLRAERLAREAAAPPVTKAKAKPRTRGKNPNKAETPPGFT